jgi:hypothetical protein
MLEEEG